MFDRNTPQEYRKKLRALSNIFAPRQWLNGLPDRHALQSAVKLARKHTIGQQNRIKQLLKQEKHKLNKGKKIRKLRKLGIKINVNNYGKHNNNNNKYRNTRTKKFTKRTKKRIIATIKRKRGF